MCRSKIISVLFPLRYPMNCATLRYGGIDTKRCIWSLHASASMISTPFYSHNFLMISPISFFSFPYTSFLLYFGAKTIWYWHLYVECDNVFISLFPFFFIMFLTSCILVTRLPNRFYYTWRLFFRQHSRLALSSANLFLLKRSISPGRTGGLLFAEETKKKELSDLMSDSS